MTGANDRSQEKETGWFRLISLSPKLETTRSLYLSIGACASHMLHCKYFLLFLWTGVTLKKVYKKVKETSATLWELELLQWA